MNQNNIKMVPDRYTVIREGSGVKPRRMKKSLTRTIPKEEIRKSHKKIQRVFETYKGCNV